MVQVELFGRPSLASVSAEAALGGLRRREHRNSQSGILLPIVPERPGDNADCKALTAAIPILPRRRSRKWRSKPDGREREITGGGDPTEVKLEVAACAKCAPPPPHMGGHARLDGFTPPPRPPPKGPKVLLGWEPERGMQPSNRRHGRFTYLSGKEDFAPPRAGDRRRRRTTGGYLRAPRAEGGRGVPTAASPGMPHRGVAGRKPCPAKVGRRGFGAAGLV